MPLNKSSLSVSTNLIYIHLSFQSQKVSQKGPEKKVSKCGKLGLTAWGDMKEILL
jgi:hypothetical protein